MRGAGGKLKFLGGLLVSSYAAIPSGVFSGIWITASVIVSTRAYAPPYQCSPKQINPQACTGDETTKQACMQACQSAQQACGEALGSACSASNGAKSAAEQAAAANSNAAAQGSNGFAGSGETQAPNAASMCSGADNSNKAKDAGNPANSALDQCKAALSGCTPNKTADAAKKQADADKKANLGEMGRLGQQAAQMQQKCDQSKQNENKMPSMSPPQMPQQNKDDKKPDDYKNDPWEYPSNTDTNTDTKTTQQIETVKFDDESQTGDVSMLPGVGPSVISGDTRGSTPGFAGGGASPGNGGQYGNGLGGNGKGGFAAAKSGLSSGGGLGGLDSSGSSRPRDGIAGADIAPKNDGSQYEVNMGGKSVLGLKSKSGEDDEVTVADLAGVPSKGGDSKSPGGKDRFPAGPLGGAGTQGANNAGGGQSLFQMVSHRYRELRKIGEI